jgi:hypothetical protein
LTLAGAAQTEELKQEDFREGAPVPGVDAIKAEPGLTLAPPGS